MSRVATGEFGGAKPPSTSTAIHLEQRAHTDHPTRSHLAGIVIHDNQSDRHDPASVSRHCHGPAHYDDDYGEPLAVNMAIELGESLAAAITTGQPITPQLQQGLVNAAATASARRAEILSTLDNEHTSLTDARDTLADCWKQIDACAAKPRYQQSPGELRRTHHQLTDCQGTCE